MNRITSFSTTLTPFFVCHRRTAVQERAPAKSTDQETASKVQCAGAVVQGLEREAGKVRETERIVEPRAYTTYTPHTTVSN